MRCDRRPQPQTKATEHSDSLVRTKDARGGGSRLQDGSRPQGCSKPLDRSLTSSKCPSAPLPHLISFFSFFSHPQFAFYR